MPSQNIYPAETRSPSCYQKDSAENHGGRKSAGKGTAKYTFYAGDVTLFVLYKIERYFSVKKSIVHSNYTEEIKPSWYCVLGIPFFGIV